MQLDASALEELKARQIAFLHGRLVSPKAEAEWRENVRGAVDAILATRVGALFDVDAVARALDAALSADAARRGLRPGWASVIAIAESRMRENEATVGEHLPAGTRAKIDALLEEPGLVPERLLREALENDAAEEVMRDVLYDALTEFSQKVNPFFAEWGLPSLLKKLSPFGLGAMGKAFDSVRAEFDRRLEPEIRKFLKGFSRRALRQFADFTIQKGDEPEFVAIRKRLAAFVLERRVSELTPRAGDRRAALAQEIALDVTLHLVTRAEESRERRRTLEMLLAVHARQTLGEAIASYGVTGPLLDADALAAATWPVVVAALTSDVARGFIARVIEEFFAREATPGEHEGP